MLLALRAFLPPFSSEATQWRGCPCQWHGHICLLLVTFVIVNRKRRSQTYNRATATAVLCSWPRVSSTTARSSVPRNHGPAKHQLDPVEVIQDCTAEAVQRFEGCACKEWWQLIYIEQYVNLPQPSGFFSQKQKRPKNTFVFFPPRINIYGTWKLKYFNEIFQKTNHSIKIF